MSDNNWEPPKFDFANGTEQYPPNGPDFTQDPTREAWSGSYYGQPGPTHQQPQAPAPRAEDPVVATMKLWTKRLLWGLLVAFLALCGVSLVLGMLVGMIGAVL